MVLMMSRPWKHPTTGIYWLRKRVPDNLRKLVGKTEEKRSLRTRDSREAKARHAQALADLERRWSELGKPERDLSDSELSGVTTFVTQWVLANGIPDGLLWDHTLFDRLWELKLLKWRGLELEPIDDDPLALTSMRRFCNFEAPAYAQREGWQISDNSRRALAKAIGFGMQQGALALARRAAGDFSTFEARSKPAADLLQSADKTIETTVTFSALLQGWASEKQPAQKTLYSWTRVINQLEAFVGHGEATKVTPDDVIRWKEALLSAGLNTKTIRDSKLAPLRAIFQWGLQNRKVFTNPAAQVQIDVRTKLSTKIRSFTEDEASLILNAARMELDPVRRWIPLLCAYSGARLSEICQLRREDIVQEAGCWCLKLMPEAGSLKNSASERIVPLHPAVERAGFLDFVLSIKRGPLFAGLPADRFGNRGGTGTKVIGRWVRSLGLNDERISPSHSWRHRFKTLGRRYGLMTDIVNAMTGHHTKTVADAYGEFPVEALYRELQKLPEVSPTSTNRAKV